MSQSSQTCLLHPAASLKKTSSLNSPLRYRIAHQREDLEQAFELVHDSYVRTGLTQPTESGLRITPYHLLPTTEVFVTEYESEVVCTISLIGDGYLGLPLQSIFPKQVADLRNDGLRVAEIGALADRRSSPVRFIETFAVLSGLVAQNAKARQYDGLVAAVHPRHARLYQRILPFEQIGELSECPYANDNPAVMIQLIFEEIRDTPVYQRYFGCSAGQLDVAHRPWSKSTREYFRKFLQTRQQRADQQANGSLTVSALTRQYPSDPGCPVG